MATPSAPTPNIVASYADRAARLGPPHGPDCPCLVCADARAAVGHRPLIPDFARVARLRNRMPRRRLWMVANRTVAR